MEENVCGHFFICGNLFLRITGKIAKIRTRKNFLPHGKMGSVISHFTSFPGPLYQSEVKCSASDMEMIFHSHGNKTHFHKKGCALGLILNLRVFGTWKWLIGHRIDYNGVGALRGQRHYPAKINPSTPPPPSGAPSGGRELSYLSPHSSIRTPKTPIIAFLTFL